MQLVSLDELKAHLNMSSGSSSDDAELVLMLNAAQEVVTGIVGDFSARTITETVDVVGGTALLSGRPTGAVVLSDGAVLAGVNGRAGIVKGLSPYLGTMTVTYDTGPGFPPDAVILACLVIAAHLWESQRGSQPLPIQGSPDESTGTSVYAPGIPTRARVLLEPFARGPQVA